MTAAQAAGASLPYLRRLRNDTQLQRQIATVITGVRRGSHRAKRKGAERAVSDKRVRRQFAAAVTAATQIVYTMREPEPPQRHSVRRAFVAIVVAGGGAAIYRRNQSAPIAPDPTHG